MGRKKFEVAEGCEVRGFMIRLYPDAETQSKLESLQDDCRTAWNWMIKVQEESLTAMVAWAVREKLVEPKPVRPVYDGLQPEEASIAKRSYLQACRTWRKAALDAASTAGYGAYKWKDWQEHFGCKHDYQLLSRVLSWKYEHTPKDIRPGAHMLQSVFKNFWTKAKKRKVFKRKQDHVPVQVRSGTCFGLGSFGARGKNPKFYNCQVKINGLTIKGRLPGKVPNGRVLEGVSLTKEADGWWASIKVESPIRSLPTPVSGSVIGIDVGLDNIAAISPARVNGVEEPTRGDLISNDRNHSFAQRLADRQARGLPVGRLHLQAKRRLMHTLYNKIVKAVEYVQTIKLERLDADIGQRGSRQGSCMRTISMLLKQRYGTRVREVESYYTSQRCSQCGEHSKDTWSYDHGPIGYCPSCGYTTHRDFNAARNIRDKEPIPLAD